MEDKTLDLLREGKLNINFKGEKIQTPSSTAAPMENSKEKSTKKDLKASSQKDKSASREKSSGKKEKSTREKHDVPQKTNAEDDDSDGGFFE